MTIPTTFAPLTPEDEALLIVRQNGWKGMSESDVAEVLTAKGFKLSGLEVIDLTTVRDLALLFAAIFKPRKLQ